jgi:hypothetical protein
VHQSENQFFLLLLFPVLGYDGVVLAVVDDVEMT